MLEKIMEGQSLPDILSRLVAEGKITSKEASIFFANYKFFQENKTEIYQQHKAKWVASLNKQLYVAPSLNEVNSIIEGLSDCKYAYVEEVI